VHNLDRGDVLSRLYAELDVISLLAGNTHLQKGVSQGGEAKEK